MRSRVWLNGLAPVLACGLALAGPDEGAAQPVTVQVTFTNLAPVGGTYVTPVWFGFHDGGFDVADLGQNAAGTFVCAGPGRPTDGWFGASACDLRDSVSPIARILRTRLPG